MADSLIQTKQLELVPSSEMDGALFASGETSIAGEFTGERLFKQRPETYRAIVQLLAERVPMHRIATILSVSVNTVMAVRDREPVSIETVKKELSRLAHAGAALAMEGIIEDFSNPTRRANIPTGTKAMVAGILTDKGQLLAGEATARLEVTDATPPDHDAYARYLDELKRVGTGLGAEKPAQKGATDGTAGTQAAPGDGPAGTIEVESTVEPT